LSRFVTRQGELFAEPKPARKVVPDREKLLRKLRSAEKGGRVNGMSKAALRRYAPPKLPKVTLP
jgi:hypothetical protein